MDFLDSSEHRTEVLYLTRDDVISCCERLDAIAIAARTLRDHAQGRTTVPAEAYLGWETPGGFEARSLAMPGALTDGETAALGIKVINASLGNVRHGISRSQGYTMLFDAETARPVVFMEAAYISALRTAAVSFAATEALAVRGSDTVALIGSGTLARAHLAILPARYRKVALFDQDSTRAERLARALRTSRPDLEVAVADDVGSCVRGASVVIPVTTTTEPYLPLAWLQPGTVVVNVSLDDVRPDVVIGADAVFVDDWGLVSHDDRRLLGRMYRDGRLLDPDGRSPRGTTARRDARAVDGTIGQLLSAMIPGRRSDSAIILVNPFGMSVQDIAFAAEVHRLAVHLGLGTRLPG